MSQRENLEFEGTILSLTALRCMDWWHICMLSTPSPGETDFIHCLRDPTRGGAATTLNEIAKRNPMWECYYGKSRFLCASR